MPQRFYSLVLIVVTCIAGGALILPVRAQTPAANDALLHPETFTEKAPNLFNVTLDTSAGTFIIRVHRDWAPLGADRFYNLVKRGFYDDCRFFRVVKQFVAQFGIHGDPAVTAAWSKSMLAPDRAKVSNGRGRVAFDQGVTTESRSTQVFINLADNQKLDVKGFAPIGEIITSMVMVERIFSAYGEGPVRSVIETRGNAFLKEFLPQLDYIKTATITDVK